MIGFTHPVTYAVVNHQGESYEGDFHQGSQEGYGKYVWSSGSWYEGECKNGKSHGKGTYVSKDGEVIHGWWNDGELTVELEAPRDFKPSVPSYADKVDLGSEDESLDKASTVPTLVGAGSFD